MPRDQDAALIEHALAYRVSRQGGAYSAWTDSARPVIVVAGPSNTDTFTIDVIARDQVGNQSPTTTVTVAASPVDPQAICDGAFETDDEGRRVFCHTDADPGTAAPSLPEMSPTDGYGLTRRAGRRRRS
jgi:hypothetical protein